MSEKTTKAVVDRLYEAYFAGDGAGMVQEMSDDVHIRFLGRTDFRGKDRAREFFVGNTPLLVDLEFTIHDLVVDGDRAAAIWSETATTVHGRPYSNHGVDVFQVVGGEVVCLHENNDVLRHREHFGGPTD